MDGLSFYQNLKSFHDFSHLIEEQYFSDVPDSWYVVLSDIRGSTKAIQEGRYKQVNMIGASSITCVLNAIGSYEFPFVFGGDGSTMIIPSLYLEKVSQELSGLQNLAKNDFNIELRVGYVPVKLLYQQNHTLKVGKYQLSPGNYLAQFKGTALTRAEQMIKNSEPGAVLLPANDHAPELRGLSCRLNPLKSANGVILSVLCQPRASAGLDSQVILQELLREMRVILKNDFKSASPVSSAERLSWNLFSPTLKDEVLLQKKKSHYYVEFVRTFFWSLIATASIKWGFRLGPFDPQKYKTEFVFNTDFKKFDEVLRMVIDCSPTQVNDIKNLLEKMYDQKKIFFGCHESREALVTCVVSSASSNQHVHFVDGGSGGYALAAVQLKKQIKEAHS